MGGAGILDQGDQVTAVGGIAHGHVHALVGDHPADDQVAGAEVAQYVVDGGGVENAGRSLRQHDLVGGRLQGVDHPGVRAALGQVHLRQLVIQRAVATIGGEALDDGVQDVLVHCAHGPEQALLVGDHLVLHALVEVTGCLRIDVRVAPRLDPGTLHVDEQDGGLPAARWQVARRVVGQAEHRVIPPEYDC